MGITIRDALVDDDSALARIDRLTWSSDRSPAPASPPDSPFSADRVAAADVLVAEVAGVVAGFVTMRDGLDVPAHRHVRRIRRLAVDPAFGRRGVGTALVRAAVDKAAREGATKVTLRVLASHTAARRLYAACGFGIEGVLRGEFRIDGEPVSDIVMATFPGEEPPRAPEEWEQLDAREHARRRLRTLEALLAALRRSDEVAAAMSAAPDRTAAAAALQELLGIAEPDARAILEMQWGRLTRDTLPRVEEDVRELRDEVGDADDGR